MGWPTHSSPPKNILKNSWDTCTFPLWRHIHTCLPPVSEIIDPVFTKTSPKRSFCMTENERFGLVFTKTGSINSGTGLEERTD